MSKQLVYLFLALSLGLNIGVVSMTLLNRSETSLPGRRPGPHGQNNHRPEQRPDPENFINNHLQGITQQLDLSIEQQQAIRSILEEHSVQLNQFQIAAADARRNLALAYASPDFNPEHIRILTATSGEARARRDSLSALVLIAEASVLTTEQRQKYADVAPEMHSGPPPHPKGSPPPRPKDGPPPRPKGGRPARR